MIDHNSMVIMMIIALIGGISAALIAKNKGRNPLIWFFLTLLCVPLGLFILCLLSPATKREEQKVPAETLPRQASSEAAFSDDLGGEMNDLHSRRLPTNQAIDWYFIDQNLETVGPLSMDQLRKALIDRHLDPTTYIWCEEFSDWTQISEFQNGSILFDADLL